MLAYLRGDSIPPYTMPHTNANKDKLALRVRRIIGQLGAIERTLEGDVDCTELMRQVASARGAINGLMDEIVEDHLREHVAAPGLSDRARAAGAHELVEVLRRYGKK